MELTVYGAESVCASCVQAPPSRATAEWLEAALQRRFGGIVSIRYVDVHRPDTEADRGYCEKILSGDYFYPLVVAEGRVLGEGIIALKPIFAFVKATCSGAGDMPAP